MVDKKRNVTKLREPDMCVELEDEGLPGPETFLIRVLKDLLHLKLTSSSPSLRRKLPMCMEIFFRKSTSFSVGSMSPDRPLFPSDPHQNSGKTPTPDHPSFLELRRLILKHQQTYSVLLVLFLNSCFQSEYSITHKGHFSDR